MKTKFKNLCILLVLLLAAMHCIQSIFDDNTSFLDLQKYETGQEKMPFQGRVGMIPLLRWGHTHYAAKVAARDPGLGWGWDAFTQEKMVSYQAALLSLGLIVLMCSWYGMRVRPKLWWLCPALAIVVFYITYAARADQNLWYPYDLPHAALFTAALLALLEGQWVLMLALFLVDLPVRETSIYLIPCVLAVGWARHKLGRAVVYSAGMAVVWLAVHIAVARHFRANASDTRIHLEYITVALLHPHFWPQAASVFGYLWLPLALGWRRLTRDQIALLAGALPGILVSAVFGIWIETRVWAEWNGIAACLAFSVFVQYMRQINAPDATENIHIAEPPVSMLSEPALPARGRIRA